MYILLLVFFQYFNAKQSRVSNKTINNQRQRGAENAWTDKKSKKIA